MPNATPNKPKDHFFSFRVDEEFSIALRELRRLYEDLPTQSEAVRRAVVHDLERIKREKGKRA